MKLTPESSWGLSCNSKCMSEKVHNEIEMHNEIENTNY